MSATDFAALGHNSTRELDLIAGTARRGLELVAAGEGKAIEGWQLFGGSLNIGRSLFEKGGQGDKDFGAWKVASQLGTPSRNDAAAAMWAAREPEQFGQWVLLSQLATV